MALRFPLPYSRSATRGRDRSPRFVVACCASLAVHVWLARELPASAQRAGGAAAPLIVRLEAAEPHAELLSETRKTGVAGLAHATLAGKEREAAPSRDHASARGVADAAGVAPRADTTYYAARELDAYPALLTPLSVEYPVRVPAEDRGGRAVVMLSIDARGRVKDVSVMEGDPPDYFDDAARRTFEHAVFSPGRRNGVPVRSRVLIELTFDRRAAVVQTQ